MAVVFDHHAAAAGVAHNGFDLTGLHGRPPGIDVGPHLVFAAFLVVQVEFHRAAAHGLVNDHGLDAHGIQHPGGGVVDVGQHRRLHATGQQQHLARVLLCRPGAVFAFGGHLGADALGQQAAHGLAQLHRRGEQGRAQALFQRPALQAFAQGALYLGIDHFAANVDQAAILHAAGAGGFAVQAGQAAVQVQLGGTGGLGAFHDLFDEVDAPARAVQLIAQGLVGGAGGGAKTAVHAFAQDGFGLKAVGGALKFRGQMGLHGRSFKGRCGQGSTGRADQMLFLTEHAPLAKWHFAG